MSEQEKLHEDIPRLEPWLVVMLSSIVPAIVIMYVPGYYLVPLIATTAALFAAGLLMLRRQTMQKVRAES